MNSETLTRVLEAVLPKGAKLKQAIRNGIKAWVVQADGIEVVSQSKEELAITLEAAARSTKPLASTSPNTHLFNRPCQVEFAEKRCEFYLVQGDFRVHLTWHGPGTRWRAHEVTTGERLKYLRDFKLDWTENDRKQPALQAWLAY